MKLLEIKGFTPAKLKDLPITGDKYEAKDTTEKYLRCRVSPTGNKSLFIYKRVNGKPERYPLNDLSAYRNKKVEPTIQDDYLSELQRCKAGLSKTWGRKQVARKKHVKRAKEAGDEPEIDTDEMTDMWNEPNFRPTLGQTLKYYCALKSELKQSTKDGYAYKLLPAEWDDMVLEDINFSTFQKKYTELQKLRNKQGKEMMVADNFLKSFGIMYRFADEQLQELDNEKNQRSILPVPIKKSLLNTAQTNMSDSARTSYIKKEHLKDWWQLTERLPDLTENGDNYRDYLQFTLLNGGRKEEALKLTWKQVDFKSNDLVFINTKTKKDLLLPMSDYIRKMMERRYKNRDTKDKSERVFKLKSIRYGMKIMAKNSEINYMTHDTRRSFASYCIPAGVNWLVMKMMMNHAKPKNVTADYAQLDSESLLTGTQQLTDYVIALVLTEESEADIPSSTKD